MTEINEKQKWPQDKRKYDREYLRVFGVKCPDCKGVGQLIRANWQDDITAMEDCKICKGLGYIEKPKGSDYLRMKKDQEKGIANYE